MFIPKCVFSRGANDWVEAKRGGRVVERGWSVVFGFAAGDGGFRLGGHE
jgi:hypothetical protein